MKQQKHLCLKERWGRFVLILIATILCGYIVYQSNISGDEIGIYTGGILCMICIIADILLLNMNLRRKRIQKEFLGEFEKDIRKKEIICPKCGALIGTSGICPKCGSKR